MSYSKTSIKVDINVHMDSIDQLVNITFNNYIVKPSYGTWNLYVENEIVSNLTIPNGVESINDYTFAYCKSIKNIILPNGLSTINTYAFSHCFSLQSIAIPYSVTSVNDNAFIGCTSLNKVYYGGYSYEWNSAISFGKENENLTNATIYFYSENEPENPGLYWHFTNEGQIEVW